MANNTFQLKRSLTSGNVPSGSQLASGELAINIPDHRLFTKDESNTVVDVFGQSVNTTANVQFRNGTFTGNLSVTGVTSLTGSIASSNTVSGTQIISTVVQGTAPLQVTSTTVVANLNADLLDGQQGTYYSNLQNATNILNMDRGGSNSSLAPVAGGLVYSNTQGLSITVAGTTGQYLISNGTSTPVWKNPGDLAVGYAWTVNNGVYTTGSYANPTWITSLDKAKVGLGNVTNESKETMFASPTFTGTVTATNDVIVGGNLTVQGTQFIVSTNTSSYTAGILSLHKPAAGWITNDDGTDIGFAFNHYDTVPVPVVIVGGSANGTHATLQVARDGVYAPGHWVTVTGVIPSEFNGTFKISATTSNTFSYPLVSSNTVNTTGQLGMAARYVQFNVSSGTTNLGSKISTINYTAPALALSVGDVVTIAGCIPEGYNGTWTVLTASVGTFTFQNIANFGPITTLGYAVTDNRKAQLGWSNESNALEYYKVGIVTPAGTFAGAKGAYRGSRYESAPSPGQPQNDLINGLALRIADPALREVWSFDATSGSTTGQIKIAAFGSQKISSTNTNVTYSNAATLFITNAPEAGNNVTITNPYAIQVAAGKSLFGGNVEVQGVLTANDFVVQGNLTVSGTTTYINTQTLSVGDNIITLNADLGAVAPTENAGIEVNRGSSANVSLLWDETNDRWSFGNGYVNGTLAVTGTSTFTGLITGTITSANNADYLDGQHGAYYTNATNLSTGTVPAARLPQANATTNGAVLILDSVSNTSIAVYAASANSVKTAYDAAIAANTLAASKVSKAGDTMTGALTVSNTISVGNTTVTGFVNATAGVNTAVLSVGTSFVANTTGAYHAGLVNAASFGVGTSFTANSTGVFPGSNTVGTSLGAAASRWVLNANTGNFSGAVAISSTLGAGNTTITGWANVSANVQVAGTLNANDVIIAGNLTVSGTTTYINTTQLNIGDNILVLNADLGAVAPTENAGFAVNRGTSANVQLVWDETNDRWTMGNTYIQGTITANTGAWMNFGDGSLYVNALSKYVGIDTTAPVAPLTIGASAVNFTNPIVQFTGNANSYIQLNGRNANTGNNASSDLMLIADNGSDTTNYIDVGINSSTYNQAAYGVMKPNSGYLFVNGGDLTIGTQTNHDILFHTGNTLSTSVKAGLYANGSFGIGNTAPADKLSVQGFIYTSSGIKIGGDQIAPLAGLGAVTYTGNNLDVSAQEPAPSGMAIDETNGTRLYVVGSTNKTIYQYTLSVTNSLSGATYANKSFSVAIQDNDPQSIWFKADGTKLFVVGNQNDRIYEYNLGTAWDVSTATFVQFLSVAAQTSAPRGMTISPTGSDLYITGGSSVLRYTLSTPWNISTAAYVSALDVSAYETAPSSVDIKNNGLDLYVAGSASNQFIAYKLSAAYDLATAAYSSRVDVSQVAGLDCNNLQEVRGSQFALALFGDQARIFEYTASSPAARLSGSRFVADVDTHLRGQVIVYEPSKFAKGLNSYGNTTIYTARLGNTTFVGNVYSTATTHDVEFGLQTTGSVIVGGTTQTGFIQLGRSTATQVVSIANGATTSGNTKTVNIGTGGLAGANTTINIGSASGTGSIILNELTTVSNNINVSGVANVAGNLNVTGTINRSPVITTTLTGDLTGTASATLANLASNTITVSTTLANTSVTPGVYGNSSVIPQITVDSKGRVTSIANVVTVAAGVTNFDYFVANNTLRIESAAGYSYATITGANTFSVSNTLSVTGTTTLGDVNASGNANFDSGTLFVDATNNRVGVGNTTPATTLEVAGNLGIGGRAVNETAAVQTTSTTQTVLTSFSATTYGCAKLLIQATRGSSRDVSEVLVTHDGVTAYAAEYGSIRTANAPAIYSLDVDISGGNVRVLVTSSNTTSTLYKAAYTMLGI